MGSSGFGDQKLVWLTQHASRLTLSAKPNAWNISIVRTLIPSALPFVMLVGLRSTIIVSMSGNRLNWAARHSPAGPVPTISTSTRSGSGAWGSRSVLPGAAALTSGSPPRKPSL